MRSEHSKSRLVEEFPELENEGVTLQKEIFAHFGLAFMKFGLVECSLIIILTYLTVGERLRTGKIRSRSEWEAAFDKEYERAAALTFGNLTKSVTAIEEFHDLSSDFSDAKRLRNYFAHHFMREEAAYFETDEGCWLLLAKIADVRHRILGLEDALKPRFEAMCSRLKLPLPSQHQIGEMVARLCRNARDALAQGSANVGWEN